MTLAKNKRTLNNSFWNQLENKNREEINNLLISKLGEPNNDLNHNLLFELTKKVWAYYSPEPQQSHTAYSLLGTASQIVEKRFKEGKRRGQIFYSVQLKEGDKFRALKEDLPPQKWDQVQKLAILGKNLVFKYKFWLTNKDLLDFYTHEKK